MRAYEARKKLEMTGAMVLSSAETETLLHDHYCHIKSFNHCHIFTDEDERYSDDEGQEVSSDWLVVFTVTFGEELEGLVDVVFAESLRVK